MKKTLCMCLCVLILFSTIGVYAQDINEIREKAEKTAEYLIKANDSPYPGFMGGEWLVFGLKRLGYEDDGYFSKYIDNLKNEVKKLNGVLSERKNTEYSRTVVALSSLNEDPSDFTGYNLLSPLSDGKKTVAQGINGAVWGLIAIDTKGYFGNDPELRKFYISYILDCRNDDGGFSYSGTTPSDADLTAMALTALSNYRETDGVEETIVRGLEFLSGAQNDDGTFGSGGQVTCESCAQVLVMLSALGIPENDSRFIKNGNTVYSAMMGFGNENGAFFHLKGDEAFDEMASEQALYAQAAYIRFLEKKAPLFVMNDEKYDEKMKAMPFEAIKKYCKIVFFGRVKNE